MLLSWASYFINNSNSTDSSCPLKPALGQKMHLVRNINYSQPHPQRLDSWWWLRNAERILKGGQESWNSNTCVTDGLYLSKRRIKRQNKGLLSIFYTIFKLEVIIWFRFKNFWNVTFFASSKIKAIAFTFGFLFYGPMAHFSPVSKSNLKSIFFMPIT